MDFISLKFVALVIASVIIFYLLNQKLRIGYLAILSCGFISTFSYNLLFYVLIYSLINYFIGLKIQNSNHKILLYRTGILINISQLVFLKYASFAIDPFFRLFESKIFVSHLSEIIIPIGISYFTLQGIGYLINIKMGWEKPEKKFLHFLLYITYFPKFLSGPVERSNHFLPQLSLKQEFNEKQVSDGLRIALIGFFKKVAIANQLAPYIISAYADIHTAEPYSLLILFLIVPLYLYFDFSGYTDIAIGFSKLFGFDLLPNFNRPFLAENVSTFWKRFHMSLSLWFNDYIFRQTSFKRRKWGVWASVYAVFLTFILFGIWHGAGWNFMVLGLLQALAINYEFFTKKWRTRLYAKAPDFVRIWFGRIITYLFYCGSLVFFFSQDLKSAFIYFSKLTEISGPVPLDGLSTKPFEVLIYIPIFLFIELLQNDFTTTYNKLESFWFSEKPKNRILRWAIYSTLITIIFVVGLKAQQFIYANF